VSLHAQVLADNLAAFAREAWHVLHPGEPLVWSWHLQLISDQLQALMCRQYAPDNKLLINVPPGTGKSLWSSVFLPAWYWLQTPHAKVLAASADRDVVARDAIRHRDLCTSEWYQDTFRPSWVFDKETNAKTFYRHTGGGARVSRTVGQSVTGHRFDLGIVDDPLDARDAVTGNHRLVNHVRWFRTVYSTRRNGAAPIVVMMQRLHDNDLAGYILREEAEQWQHLCLPLEYERGRCALDPRTEEGELLSPRFDAAFVDALRKTLGPDYFGQAQQRPTNPEGTMFKMEWLRSWAALPELEYYVVSIDTALRVGVSNDYTVVQVWGIKGGQRYLVHQERGRWNLPDIMDAVHRVLALYPRPRVVLVERSSNGAAVIAQLGQMLPQVIGVDQYTERNSKLSRAQAVLPQFAAGNVFIPSALDRDPITGNNRQWVGEYLQELLGFPKMAHDDQVDATTQALGWIMDETLMGAWA